MSNSITGTPGNDLLDFSSDTMDDSINGLAGFDTIIGGAGNDTIVSNLLTLPPVELYSAYSFDPIQAYIISMTTDLDGGGGQNTITYAGQPIPINVVSAIPNAYIALSPFGTFEKLTNFQDFIGGSGNDTFTLGAEDNNITGGAGDDCIDGGGGFNTIHFTDSSTHEAVDLNRGYANGSDGFDTLGNIRGVVGTVGADEIIGLESGGCALYGGDSNDDITAYATGNTLDGGAGTDTLRYGTATGASLNLRAGTITAGGVTNTITGFENLIGSQGNDTIQGDAGDNSLEGNTGTDTLDYSGAGAVSVNLTTGRATGDGNDSISGFENVLGSAYNDSIQGDAGNNGLAGGGGRDTLSFADALGGVSVDLLTNRATGFATGNDSLDGFEDVVGSAYNDTIQGDAGANSLSGGAGADVLSYAGATGAVQVNLATGRATGAAGNDSLSGFEAVTGGDYNDILKGGNGADTLIGGAGDDTLSGGLGYDSLDGGAGEDMLQFTSVTGGVNVNLATGRSMGAGQGIDTLAGFEDVTGGDYNDTIVGDNGNNVLTGGLGNDSLAGGLGVDTANYAGATGAVQVNLGTGLATGAAGNDTLAGIEAVLGSGYADSLTGGAGADALIGGAGADTLVGGAGADTLAGGFGYDSLDGGAGEDLADYSSSTAAVTVNLATGRASGGAGNDTLSGIEDILGGSGNDTLTGDAGNNVLIGGLGDDSLAGGGGIDTADYSSLSGAAIVNLSAGTVSSAAGHDTLSGIEVVKTGAGNDAFYLRPGTDCTLDGGAGTNSAYTTHIPTSYDLTFKYDDLNLPEMTMIVRNGTSIDSTQLLKNIAYLYMPVVSYGIEGTDTVLTDLLGYGFTPHSIRIDGSGPASLTLPPGICTSDIMDVYVQTPGTLTSLNLNASTADYALRLLAGSNGADTILGGTGNDTLSGGLGYDSLSGGTGEDMLLFTSATGGVNVNLATGRSMGAGQGIDTLVGFEDVTGGDYNDTLVGDTGANLFIGGLGNDSMNAGTGTDTVDYSGATGAVQVNLVTGRATGAAGNDSLAGFEAVTGSNYNDLITGGSAAETLLGGTGNDTIIGGAGYDSLDGGAGEDLADYSAATAGVNVNLSTGRSMGAGLGIDTLAGFEDVTGGGYNDTLVGDTNSNVLSGGAGNDSLNGGGGYDSISGGAGNDKMVGGGSGMADYSAATGAVQVNLNTGLATGADGNDTLSGFVFLQGGVGADSLTGDNRDNVLWGGAGNDSLYGAGGLDCLLGGDGNDRLTQGSGNSLLMGGAGADLLIASAANAVLAGGTGNDTLNPGAGADVILFNAGDGKDNVNGSDVDQDDTVSLGGGITRSQLSLTKSGNNLVLNTGAGEGLTFMNWYGSTSHASVLYLQLIEGAAADFNASSSDPMLNSQVLIFNFSAIVADFNGARASDASITSWSLIANPDHFGGGSNTVALGGDLSYQYGMTGNLSAVGATGAGNALVNTYFGWAAQNLQSSDLLASGAVKLD